MERKYDSNEQALEVAKEAFWLAWNACGGTTGLGFLQDRPTASKEDVWNAVAHYPNEPYGDYVFGRMMKTGCRINGDTLAHSDGQPRGDYQGWAYRYPSYAALFDAAEKVVKSQDNATVK